MQQIPLPYTFAREPDFTVQVATMDRAEIRSALAAGGVRTNQSAEELLDAIEFAPGNPAPENPTVPRKPTVLRIYLTTLAELGFPTGATLDALLQRAATIGLFPCPLAAAPYLRLQFSAQADAPDSIMSRGRAPSGAVTIASVPPWLNAVDGVELGTDAEPTTERESGAVTIRAGAVTIGPGATSTLPTGFYLRTVDGTRWLRGYRCDRIFEFSPDDVFAFTAGDLDKAEQPPARQISPTQHIKEPTMTTSSTSATATSQDITVRPVDAHDESQWKTLFRGYRKFYELAESEDVVATVWSWLLDPEHEEECLVAESAGTILAIGDYRPFSRPTTGSSGLWLDDLFTSPEARGRGAGRAIIDRLTEIAATEGRTLVRWVTAADNHRAQGLYDQVGTRTSWLTYDAAPAEPSASR